MASRYLILALAGYVSAQTSTAQFNQVINLNGDMNLNSIQFPDGSRVEAFSQTQRQLLVNQNQAPLPGNQVTGSTGNPFTQLTQNSLIIQTNGGTDLVGAQIELPINQQMLQQAGNISPDNTYVAKLSPDRRSWMIMETIKSVNGTDNTVRLVKMNNIDGEYIALGRQTRETSLSLTQFSANLNQGFNVTGSGIQENEFTDGFRMSVRASQPMLINTNVINGVSSTMLAALGSNVQSINNYRYKVTTNLGGVVPNINRMVAVVQLPINPVRLQTVAKNQGAGANSMIRLSVAQRGILANPGGAQGVTGQLNKRQDPNQQAQPQPNQNPNANNGSNTNGQTNTGTSTNGQTNQGTGTLNNPAATNLLLSPTFTPIAANAVLDQMNGRLAIPVSQVDGEFIITVQNMDGQTAAGQQQGGQQIQGQGQGQGQVQGSQPSGTAQEPQGVAPQGASPQGTSPQGVSPQGVSPQGVSPQGASPQGTAAQGTSPQGTAAQGAAPQAAEPAGAAPAAGVTGASPAGVAEPAGAAPAASVAGASPAAAAPAAAPAAAEPAGAAPAAAAAAPAAPQVSSSFVTRRVKRQFGNPAASPPAPAAGSATTNGGSVLVSMAWVNEMARIQTQGLPLDVGAMMAELSAQLGGAPAAATDPLASLGL